MILVNTDNIVTLLVAVFASTGFWSLVQYVVGVVKEKKGGNSAEKTLLIALSHDRILTLSKEAIAKGYISQDNYDNLAQMTEPYFQAGGNHLAKKYWEEVQTLPIRDD